MFHFSARLSHVWLVAVALIAQMGVHCLRHREPAERSLPVGTKKTTCLLALPDKRTQERTIYPGIHRLYRRWIYICILSDRGAISALPRNITLVRGKMGRCWETY